MKIIDMKSYQERKIAYKECLKSLQNGENPITRHENRMREEDKSQKKNSRT